MSRFTARITSLAAVASIGCGCVSWPGPPGAARFDPEAGRRPAALQPPRPPVIPAAHHEGQPTSQPVPAVEPLPAARPLEGIKVLTAEEAVHVVLERNPTLDQMRATAAAAAARYPQVTSLDDPTFGFSTAPGSSWSPNTAYAARVEVSQKLPFPGKRDLKGAAAQAEAAATVEDIEDARLQLAEAARSAVADYYLAVKATGVAEENARLLREFRQNAETRYKTGQGQQQDVLQAEVEIGRQEERLIGLRRARQVAVARLNTLMHLPPDSPLPPPGDPGTPPALPDVERLRKTASGRPDVRAAAARVSAEEAALALAVREYKPDFELMAAYDGFWQGANGRPLQWQVGVRTNLPVRYARRDAAVDEARANVARRRAELARLTDRINFEVQEAFERVRESDEVARLYEAKLLPAAAANVKEAQSAYVNNKLPFLNLLEAQRSRVALKDRYFEAIAESARRRAALERAVGSPLPTQER